MCASAVICAYKSYLRDEAMLDKVLGYENLNYPNRKGNVRICQFVHSIFRFLDDIYLQFKPFKLKIGEHVPCDSSNVPSQGFCSALLLRADMREFRRARTFWRISAVSARRSNPEQHPWLRTLELFQRTCLPILSL